MSCFRNEMLLVILCVVYVHGKEEGKDENNLEVTTPVEEWSTELSDHGTELPAPKSTEPTSPSSAESAFTSSSQSPASSPTEAAAQSTTESAIQSSPESVVTSILPATEGTTEGKKEGTTNPEVSSTTQTLSSTESGKEAHEGVFALKSSNGRVCLLAKFDAQFNITYPKSVSVHMKKDITAKGECGSEEKQPVLQLSWDKFSFMLKFSKFQNDDRSIERWASTELEFRYDTSSSLFFGTTDVRIITTRSLKDIKLFMTDYGRSYYCPGAEVIDLHSLKKKKKVASVTMTNIWLQPFDVEDGTFAKAQECDEVVSGSEEPVQDETVPLAVGLTLTILTLLVVLGFSVHRMYTMRKVDYNSME